MQLSKIIPIDTILATEIPSVFFASQIKSILQDSSKPLLSKDIFTSLSTRFSGMDNAKTKGQFFGTFSAMIRFDPEIDFTLSGKNKFYFMLKDDRRIVEPNEFEPKTFATAAISSSDRFISSLSAAPYVYTADDSSVGGGTVVLADNNATRLAVVPELSFALKLNDYAAQLVQARQNYDAKIKQLTDFVASQGSK